MPADIADAMPDEAVRLAETLARLHSKHPRYIDLGLSRMRAVCARLGNPQQNLPPVIHIAGTNGKGSTLAFLQAMLRAAGYRVHRYTSPHLICYNERICLDGQLIGDADFADLLEAVTEASADAPLSLFEALTAAAFLAFSRHPADVLLLETGLGGACDATNVIAVPAVTAISRLSYDHQAFLGVSIEEIAAAKAGIMKPGVPVVIAAQPEEAALAVLLDKAETIGAPVFLQGRDWAVQPGQAGFDFIRGGECRSYPLPGLMGAHQFQNAGLALACLEVLESVCVSESDKGCGIASAAWPGRLQRLTVGPLVDGLPDGVELWLDGGHNDSAAEVLAAQAKAWYDKPLHLAVGMLESKDVETFLSILQPHVVSLAALPITDSACHAPDDIVTHAHSAGFKEALSLVNAGKALRGFIDTRADKGACRILICGSLYLAGEVLGSHFPSLN